MKIDMSVGLWQIGRVMIAVVALVLVALATAAPSPAVASPERNFAAGLSASERRTFETYMSARRFYNLTLDEFWDEVSEKRAARRKKRAADQAITAKDYAKGFPPDYTGPKLSADLAKRWAKFQEAQAEKKPPREPLPGVDDFLAHAREQFGFVPERIAEREFKRRYAREALRVGLTKEQVVRVYALETSGLGTADMVAGIHPITKKGTPISTAIGYAQLLSANSTSELVKHGPGFIARLKDMAARARTEDARKKYQRKAQILTRMLAVSKSVPNEWSRHQALGRTAKGYGIHAINIDGDIGPWLQVLKLLGLKELADKRGKTRLSGAEIELMNLAGPATGLEMMTPAGRAATTPNFFERGAYGRNTIVRGKTGAELLKALDERMDTNVKNDGAVLFAQVFDEVAAEMARD
ncbi:MAG: hypothetical protein C0519_13790 [Hyphomicrobium sp.]|nr:hypothetical protein [Hyphomicrobium sp.]PPD06718.1 MAG: hypothetical protein CTY28_12115 [Hyphomicrobium sp.]